MGLLTRRDFITRTASTLALAPVAGPLTNLNRLLDAPRANSLSSGLNAPIDHIVILCQENRSLDHYLGFLPGLQSPRPLTSNQIPDAQGNTYNPYHDPTQCDFDPNHEWDGSHQKWDAGKMDGFVKVDGGSWAMGYLDAADHPYHGDLAQAFAICDNHFCSLIGPTTPNRLVLWTGSSGGWRENPDPAKPSTLQVMNWPTVAEALSAAGVTWACYAVADGNAPSPVGAFNPYVFFPNTLSNPNTWLDISAFLAQAATGTLPQVSWIITEAAVCEHPPAPPEMGQALVARIVQALMSNSSAWTKTAFFLTYDEGGGFFDHVAPPILEYDTPADHPWVTSSMMTKFVNDGQPIGPAFRVPLIAVSPWIPQGKVFHEPADHTSLIRFLEWRFGLPPVVTIAAGRRTGLSDLSSGLFDFTATPDTSSRGLPSTVDISNALTTCVQTIPQWLPPLIGPVVQPYPQPPSSVPEPAAVALAAGVAAVGAGALARAKSRSRHAAEANTDVVT
jgi:phospholipase C